MADTGCRRGGAAGLRIADLDLDKREAVVTEKGNKTRRVRFGESAEKALRRWLLKRGANAGEHVFSLNGEPVTAAAISQIIRRACKKVGVRSLGAHSLRHRKGHQFADAHIAPSVAAEAMGHSSVMTTLKHYYPRDWERAAAALDELALPDIQPSKVIPIRRAT